MEALSEEQTHAMIQVHPDFDACHSRLFCCVSSEADTTGEPCLKEWEGLTPIPGVPFYNNQFNVSSEKNQGEGLKKSTITETESGKRQNGRTVDTTEVEYT